MSKHSTLLLAIVIAALLVIGLVMSGGTDKPEVTGTDNTGNTDAPAGNTGSAENKAILEAIFAANPGENATADELLAYYDTVAAKAQDAAALEITACQGNPPVMRIAAKKNFTITNNDDQDHEITHPQFTFKVAADGQKKDAQVKDIGIYGYSCDEANLAGILFVTP